MSAPTIFVAGLVACAVGFLHPPVMGWAVLAGLVCLLAGLYRLGD